MSNETKFITCDANEAVASVAHRLTELVAIYPITPSSPMAESCDEWAAAGKKNIWGQVPNVVELQSEAGVAGTVHGGLHGGALTTTFTASQGLLLMIPILYKIAGELLPITVHVSARALAANGLSIFGDHSDVMACRATGCAMLCSNNGQEAHDFALISYIASFRASLPFIHFFDGFRTSHEVSKISLLSDDNLRQLISEEDIQAFRNRGLTPDAPTIRGTAQNPDVYFQGREAANKIYQDLPAIVQNAMDQVAKVTGRQYHLFDYYGAADAEHVVVAMGSGIETLVDTIETLNKQGKKYGAIACRLFLPFDTAAFMKALPKTTKTITVLDRTKEPGSLGEPLYLNVLGALAEANSPLAASKNLYAGRYALGSKEFTPAMVKAIYENPSSKSPKNHFTVGINDDITHSSITFDASFQLPTTGITTCVFVGLGADGTVGANKNSIKIIGEQTDNFAQGYFVYDSKKSGSVTTSHLRFGPKPIRAPYLISQADFVACSQFAFVGRQNVLGYARPGATVLLNSPFNGAETWKHLPADWQKTVIDNKLKLYVVDATAVAQATGMGRRTNTVLQTCFFAISGVLPQDEAIAQIKKSIQKTYGRKGEKIVQMNYAAVDASLASMEEVKIPAAPDADAPASFVPQYPGASTFVQTVTATLLADKGDTLPVSAIPADGTWPVGTTKFEKRNIALEIPQWDASLCIQCNKCSLVCPHAAIRPKFYDAALAEKAPAGFKSVDFKAKDFPGSKYTIQVAPEDCTGCSLCVQVCPAKDKTNPKHKALDMVPQPPLLEQERANWNFFLSIPEADRTRIDASTVKGSQFLEPLFEFSGACAGCGETPYVKLLTQLFGDRLLIANATGCSSIYGGNLPTTPYTTNKAGQGPAWANSLFEDNAEFGLGLRLAADQRSYASRTLLKNLSTQLDQSLVNELLDSPQKTEAEIAVQRTRVEKLRSALKGINNPEAKRLDNIAGDLVDKSVWIVGGDGWAYDIGYGGVDHILASGANVKIIVLDTEVYSNTGGQSSKSTPMGAVAKFAASGKAVAKKDLAMIAAQYGHVYVAKVSLGAKDAQVVTAMREAEAYNGPALIIAYSHCIAHGYGLHLGLEQQKLAVDTGYWPLFRYDPRLAEKGENPFRLDSAPPKMELNKFTANETRFGILKNIAPDRAEKLGAEAQTYVKDRFAYYQRLATKFPAPVEKPADGEKPAA